MTPNKIEAFNDWLKNSRPSSVFVYHTGHLSYDRGSWVNDGNGTPDRWEHFGPIDELGRVTLAASTEGKVYLFQRKLSDHVYEYLAIRRYSPWRNW